MVNFNSDVSLPEGRSISPTIFPTASGPRGGRVRPSARSPAPRSPRSDAARCPGPRPSAAPTPRPGCCKPWVLRHGKIREKDGLESWKTVEKCWCMEKSGNMLRYETLGLIWHGSFLACECLGGGKETSKTSLPEILALSSTQDLQTTKSQA